MARKAIPSNELLAAANKDLGEALNGASPLACALVGAAFIEKALIGLLSKFFVKCSTADSILKEGGALGDFFKCTQAAYCLGLISKGLLNNLVLVGEIRNLFAHSHEFIDFDNTDIKSRCNRLTLLKTTTTDHNESGQRIIREGLPKEMEESVQTPRGLSVILCQ
jgi:DNA-binding MltR family transcriptional regulator